MALFDAPSHNISGDEDDATVPPKTANPCLPRLVVGRQRLDYGDDAGPSRTPPQWLLALRAGGVLRAKAPPFGVVPPGLREDAAAASPKVQARRRARAGASRGLIRGKATAHRRHSAGPRAAPLGLRAEADGAAAITVRLAF